MPRAAEADKPTSVYIISMGDYVKIGVSIDPAKRLRGMTTGMPEQPILFATRQFKDNITAYAVEKMLHRRFYYQRTKGEWFKVSAQVARRALSHIKPPSREHLTPQGWAAATEEEVREAMSVLTRTRLV